MKIECYDDNTNAIIQTLPYNLRSNYKLWTNPFARNNWSFNKEVYPVVEDTVRHEKIRIKITNNSNSDEIFIEDEENPNQMIMRKSSCAMMIDALLVFEENSDTNYYQNVNDVLNE